MFIVAITRWAPGFDQQLPELAAMLGVFPYDLRMRLAGPIPVIVARVPEREAASQLMDTLRGWGHGVVACDAHAVPAAASMHQPKQFRFEGELLRTEDHATQPAEVHASEVYALIHAMVLADQHTTKERTTQSFSAARAVLSGGLVMTRTSTSNTHVTESQAEERIYVIRAGFADPLLFCQHQLNYTGLGAAMGHSSHESFASLAQQLRSFSPDAIYDDQLRRSRRKGSIEALTSAKSGDTKTSSVTSSNASSVDVAAYLLLMAHARGQL